MQHLVDVYLLKDGQHRHGIDGRQEGSEHEAMQHLQLDGKQGEPHGRTPPHRQPDGDGVVDRSDDREEQDRTEVVEERPVGHEVAGVEDDWRKEVEEEGVGLKGVPIDVGEVEDEAQEDSEDDEEAALGEDGRQLVVEVEPCIKQRLVTVTGIKPVLAHSHYTSMWWVMFLSTVRFTLRHIYGRAYYKLLG